MAVVLFPRAARAANGPTTRVRRGHWAAEGLRVCLDGRQGNGQPWDAVSQFHRPATFRLGGHVANNQLYAPGGFWQNSGDDEIKVSLDTYIQPLNQITVLFVRKKHDTTLRVGFCFDNNTTDVPSRVRIACPFSDASIIWDWGGNASGHRLVSSALSWDTNVESFAFVAGSRGSSIWRNAQLVTSQSTPITTTVSTTDFYVNGGLAEGDIQTIYFFAVLDAEWTPGQIQEWHDDPYLMLEQPKRVSGHTGAGPGGGGVVPIFMHHYYQQGMA